MRGESGLAGHLFSHARWRGVGGDQSVGSGDLVLGVRRGWSPGTTLQVDSGSAGLPQVAVDYSTRLVNLGLDAHAATRAQLGPTFEWNTDKSYLVQSLAAGVPVVPTEVCAHLRAGLDSARQRFDGVTVLKPAVGVGGQGLVVAEPGPQSRWQWDGAVVDTVCWSWCALKVSGRSSYSGASQCRLRLNTPRLR